MQVLSWHLTVVPSKSRNLRISSPENVRLGWLDIGLCTLLSSIDKLKRVLGQGSSGVVWKALDATSGSCVAIKIPYAWGSKIEAELSDAIFDFSRLLQATINPDIKYVFTSFTM